MRLSVAFLHVVALAAGMGAGAALAFGYYATAVVNVTLWGVGLAVVLILLTRAYRAQEEVGFVCGRSYQLVRDVEELQRHLPAENSGVY